MVAPQPRIMWRNVTAAEEETVEVTKLPVIFPDPEPDNLTLATVSTDSVLLALVKVGGTNEKKCHKRRILQVLGEADTFLSFGSGPNLVLAAALLMAMCCALVLNLFYFLWAIKGINLRGALMESVQWVCMSQAVR